MSRTPAANVPDWVNKYEMSGTTPLSGEVEGKQAVARRLETLDTKEAEIKAWINAVAVAIQGEKPSDPLMSEQTKWAGKSVEGHKAEGLLGLGVKSADKERSQHSRGSGRGRGRGRGRAGLQASRMQALRKQGESGLAGKGKGKGRAKMVSGPAAHDQKLDTEGTIDEDPIVLSAMGEETAGSDRATTIPDPSNLTDAALRFGLVTDILEGRPIVPRVIAGVTITEEILRWPLAKVWDYWLWGPTEVERQQAWEIQEIYRLILHRTGRDL